MLENLDWKFCQITLSLRLKDVWSALKVNLSFNTSSHDGSFLINWLNGMIPSDWVNWSFLPDLSTIARETSPLRENTRLLF